MAVWVAGVKAVWPVQFTTEAATKFVPLSVRVNGALPAVAEVGVMLVSVGTGLFTVKTCPLVVPPTGAGLWTVMAGVPAVAI